VIYLGKDHYGLFPGPSDIIITGRSFEEQPETDKMLFERGIKNHVFYNPLKFDEKTRESSGIHKAKVMNALHRVGVQVKYHYEDDPVQIQMIKEIAPHVTVIHVNTAGLVELENVRHL
jgi:hypothetical protein